MSIKDALKQLKEAELRKENKINEYETIIKDNEETINSQKELCKKSAEKCADMIKKFFDDIKRCRKFYDLNACKERNYHPDYNYGYRRKEKPKNEKISVYIRDNTNGRTNINEDITYTVNPEISPTRTGFNIDFIKTGLTKKEDIYKFTEETNIFDKDKIKYEISDSFLNKLPVNQADLEKDLTDIEKSLTNVLWEEFGIVKELLVKDIVDDKYVEYENKKDEVIELLDKREEELSSLNATNLIKDLRTETQKFLGIKETKIKTRLPASSFIKEEYEIPERRTLRFAKPIDALVDLSIELKDKICQLKKIEWFADFNMGRNIDHYKEAMKISQIKSDIVPKMKEMFDVFDEVTISNSTIYSMYDMLFDSTYGSDRFKEENKELQETLKYIADNENNYIRIKSKIISLSDNGIFKYQKGNDDLFLKFNKEKGVKLSIVYKDTTVIECIEDLKTSDIKISLLDPKYSSFIDEPNNIKKFIESMNDIIQVIDNKLEQKILNEVKKANDTTNSYQKKIDNVTNAVNENNSFDEDEEEEEYER